MLEDDKSAYLNLFARIANFYVNLLFRDVVSDIPLGLVFLDIRAHDCWRDLLRHSTTAQIWQVRKFLMVCLRNGLIHDVICIHRFFPLLIIIMGVLLPLTSGVISSAAVAFVYRASGYQMPPLYALFWGIGQTVVPVSVGFTRILATL